MIVAVGQGVLALESDQFIPFSGVGVASRTQDMSVTSWFLFVATFVATSGKVMQNMHPIVDAGLFVISGVMTCGDGRGYCLLGLDCTLDEEFLPDPQGHCRGLQNAFTPSAHFSCCKYKNLTGQDNFVYTMVDPAVSTLVNSYSESSTEKMNIENQNTGSNIKDATKHDADQGIKDANIIEEFHKHMEKVKLKNDDKEHKVPVSTNTNTMVTSTQDYESVAIESNEDSEIQIPWLPVLRIMNLSPLKVMKIAKKKKKKKKKNLKSSKLTNMVVEAKKMDYGEFFSFSIQNALFLEHHSYIDSLRQQY
ncbi:uncharacterized protein LOC113465593 [Diaphorina citri]|uniref:Uncharacterized protein LOC113465593 n=1 Tax=Diaphorina citri TaxID=121845 RepID=A0A3Q0IN15_DIACI|nr:uncharacterized protein LOC113465593 [Diaphorina citri]